MEKAKRRKEDEGFVSSSSSVDRISELPRPILHHILSFLPQNEAAPTCVLSKLWHHVWCTRPIIEFRLCRFPSIFDHTLERYLHQNLFIKRFVVKLTWVDLESTSLLEKWIPIVLLNLGVETFHLISYVSDYYALPSVVFHAQFLTELYLWGFKVNSMGDNQICLKHLQTLMLTEVYIDDETLEKIMTSCPLIQRVDLQRCNGLRTVKVNSNINHFVCVVSGRNIEIEDPSVLETIKIMFCLNLNTKSHHFLRLKSLYLSDVQLPEEFSSSFSSSDFPFLEDLELRNCSGVKEVRILSRSVKRLIIVDMLTITIDAPGLLYFEFSSRSYVPSISFATVPSGEWNSNISVPFQPKSFSTDILLWSLKLNEVLNTLRKSRITLNLPCDRYSSQNFKVFNYVGCYKPVVVEHLNLRGIGSSDDFASLFNCLFRIVRPRYIYTRIDPSLQSMRYLEINKLVEFLWKTNLKDGEFSRCYFWRQELKELSIEILDRDSRRWRIVQGRVLTKRWVMNAIRIQLEWRESALIA